MPLGRAMRDSAARSENAGVTFRLEIGTTMAAHERRTPREPPVRGGERAKSIAIARYPE
jgi:hypothetical protein